MAKEIDEFTPDSIAEIAKAVRTLRWQVQNVMELAKSIKRHRPTHEVRTGVMSAKPGQSYPADGCVLPVQFQDVDFAETAGTCDSLDTKPWTSKFVIARAYDGRYITEGTDVLIVKTAATKGRRWWIIPIPKRPGSIAFTMLTDRTRETTPGGMSVGYASALITDSVGEIGDEIGDTITIVFTDKRWLESVKFCEGRADYIDGSYVVTEVQGLVQGFWFRTLEDRSGYGEQDVKVEMVQNVGHANDDFPREDWKPGSSFDCGTATYEWQVDSQLPRGGIWTLISSNFDPCCYTAFSVESLPAPADPTIQGQTYVYDQFVPGPNCDQQQQQEIKVRYLANTFPRMLTGALGYCQLDNDIENEDDNSTMRYYVVQSDQFSTRIKAALTAPMCGSAASIAAFSILDFAPFGQLPTNVGTSIPNPKEHYGKTGDVVNAEWNETVERWEVYDVTKHVITNSSLSSSTEDGCTTISKTDTQIAVELCDDGQTETLLAYRTQTVSNVTGFRLDKGQTGSGSGIQCDPKLIVDHTEYEGLVLCQDAVPDTEELALENQPVVWDLDMDGCPTWTNTTAIVIGVCGNDTEVAADCEPCPTEGSGSG